MIDRSRLTEGITPARLSLEIRRAVRPTILVVFCASISLTVAAYIGINVSRTLLRSTESIRFAVNDASGVVAGLDQVRVEGIPAGTISNLQFVGNQAVITATVDTKYGPIYRNAQATLRPNSALEDMYLDIVNRGTPAAGSATGGPPLPSTQTDTSVNIDDVLDAFRAPMRDSLRTALANLGNGLRDRGAALQTAFIQIVPFLQAAGRISRQLAVRSDLTRQLVHNSAILMHTLAQRQAEITSLVANGSDTLSTLQQNSGNLGRVIDELPPTLEDIDSSFSTLRAILPSVNGAIRNLEPVSAKLPTALNALKKLSAAGTPALHALELPVRQLRPLATSLVPLAESLGRAVKELDPQIPTLNRGVSDLAACKIGIQGFFQWDASLTKFGDSRGPSPRGNLAVGASSTGAVSDPFEYAPQACTPGRIIGGRLPTPADEH